MDKRLMAQETSKDVAHGAGTAQRPAAILPGGAARDVQGDLAVVKETYLTTLMVFIMVVISMVFFCGGRLRARPRFEFRARHLREHDEIRRTD